MIRPLHKSLALRLAATYAVLMTLCLTGVFFVLYTMLASALEERERSGVTRFAERCGQIYLRGGPLALRASLTDEKENPDGRSLFLRVLEPDGSTLFAVVPDGWVEPQLKRILVPDGWGGWKPKDVQVASIPRDADQDFTVVSGTLHDGRLLQVARSSDNRTTLLAPLRRSALAVAPAALLIAAVAGTLAAWRFTRPIRLVKETTRRILETGDLAARVPAPKGSGELSELVQQLNTVLARNASLIAAQRETLDNLAHDIRTPLARLRGVAELALSDQADTQRAGEALADCVEEAERVQQLLESMLDVTAAETGTLSLRREDCDLGALAARAGDLYLEVAEERGLVLEIVPSEPVVVDADPARLGQAVANLVDNALKYTPSGGRVSVSVSTEQGRAVLAVSDTGPGIAVEEQDKIWRRLYRSDRSRSLRGLGLGLSLVKAIVEAHGGSVSVESALDKGATFRLSLPLKIMN